MHLSKIRLVTIAAMTATVAISSAETPSRFGFKLGLIAPTDSTLRDNAGKTGLDIGIAYFLQSKPLLKGQTLASVELDYLRVGGNDDNFEGFHLGYAERTFLGKEDDLNGLYAGFAAGLALNRFTGTTTVSSGQGGSVTTRSTDDRTQVFGELLLGYRLQMNYGVEAFVRMSPKFNDVTPSVYGIRASYRF